MFSLVQEEMAPQGQMSLLKRSAVLPLCTLGFFRMQGRNWELGGEECVSSERGTPSSVSWGS